MAHGYLREPKRSSCARHEQGPDGGSSRVMTKLEKCPRGLPMDGELAKGGRLRTVGKGRGGAGGGPEAKAGGGEGLRSPAFLGGEVGPELREPSAGPRATPGRPAEAGGKTRRRKPWRKPRRGPPMCEPGSHAALPPPPPAHLGAWHLTSTGAVWQPDAHARPRAGGSGSGYWLFQNFHEEDRVRTGFCRTTGEVGGGGAVVGPSWRARIPLPGEGERAGNSHLCARGSQQETGWGWGGRRGLRGRSHGHRRS